MANILSSILNGAKTIASTLNNVSPNSTATKAVSSTPTISQATAPVAYDPTAQINALKQAQLQQSVANLGAKRDTVLSSLNGEQAKITPAYYDKRNQTSTASQMQAKNLSEFMANRGLTNSGTNAQAELTRNNTLQGNIGSLNRQELEANQDVERRRTDVNNTYASDLAAAQAGIEANAMDRLISAQQQSYNNALSQYNTDRSYNYNVGRDTVSDNRYNTQYADSRADVAYNRDYQTKRDITTDKRYDTQYADSRADVQYDRDYRKSRDTVSDNQWKTQFDYTKLTNDQKIALDQARFDFEKEQTAINNTYRQGTFEWQKAMDSAQLELQRKQLSVSQSNSSNSTTARTSSQGNNANALAWEELSKQIDGGTAYLWLEQYKDQLKDTLGSTEYNKLVKTYQDVAAQKYDTQQDYRKSDKQRMIMEGQ